MNSIKTVKILLSPLRLHSASSVQIPQSTNRYNSMLLSVHVSPLKLHSATKIIYMEFLTLPYLETYLGTLGVSIEEV